MGDQGDSETLIHQHRFVDGRECGGELVPYTARTRLVATTGKAGGGKTVVRERAESEDLARCKSCGLTGFLEVPPPTPALEEGAPLPQPRGRYRSPAEILESSRSLAEEISRG